MPTTCDGASRELAIDEIARARDEGFKSDGQAQRFLSAFGIISSHFRVGRHLFTARSYRAVMKTRFAVWEEVIDVNFAA